MAEFDTHAFCECCGGHWLRMPFGDRNRFWLHGSPCPHCGAHTGKATFETARRGRVGRWPWQRGWVGRHGHPIDVVERSGEAA